MQRSLLIATVLCATTVSLRADTLCHTVPSVSAPTNWSTTVTLPRFDPALGLLRIVRLELTGSMLFDYGMENIGSQPSTTSLLLAGLMHVFEPQGGVVWVTAHPVLPTITVTLPPFDGTIDFAGPSGTSVNDLPATDTGQVLFAYPSSAQAALFVGLPDNPGVVVLPLSATGSSSASGDGSVVTYFSSAAAASVAVCYEFDLDCNGNGTADASDIANGTSLDANGDGIPDECFAIDAGLCPGDGSLGSCPCGNTSAPGSGAGCANSFGTGGLLAGSGVARVTTDSLLLTASGLPPSSPILFYQGTNAVGGPSGAQFGDGLRCVGGTVVRMGRETASSGMASFPPAGSPGIAMRGGVGPGPATRYYQCWYRNSAAFCTPQPFNMTNGMRILWGV